VTQSDKQSQPEPSIRCPHCGHNHLVQIRASEVVAIYKCSNCGELIAPVKPGVRSGEGSHEIKRSGEK